LVLVAALATACSAPTKGGLVAPATHIHKAKTQPTGAPSSSAKHGQPAVPAEPTTTGPNVGSIPNPTPGVFDSHFGPPTTGIYPEQIAGSYKLNGKTVSVSSIGTLTIQVPNAAGVQLWEESSGKNQPVDSMDVIFDQAGISLQAESLGLSASSPTCDFSPPVPILPEHPVFGSTFVSIAACGSFSAHVNGEVQGTETIMLSGVSYATLVVQATVRKVGPSPAVVVETDWVSPALRLVLRSTQVTTTSYDGSPYQISTTTSLTQAHPAEQ
jgi:hypothetical protein